MEKYLLFLMSFLFGCFFTVCFLKLFKKNNNSALESLKTSLDEIKTLNQINSTEIKTALQSTVNLAKTLTTNQNLKGKFGEECLENVIKACFPNENTDYFKQFITKNSDDKIIKPDYIVKLPNDKTLIIDCKLNLEKFIEYKESIGLEIESIRKNELIKDLNSTINDLSNKKYQSALDLNSINFILMYIPLEPVLSLIYTDSDFLSVVKNANDKNIIIVGNSSVITTIRLVKELWANKIREENISNIIEIAQNIYNLVAQHSNNLLKLKDQINDFNSNFNKEFDKIRQDNKIFLQAKTLKDFGIKPFVEKNGRKLEQKEINSEFLT